MRIPVSPDLKKFCKAFFIILLGIFFIDLLIGTGLKYLYNHQRTGRLYRTSYSIKTTTADFLVFGSSRANHDYDPHVFEQKLNATFYNCGRDGQGAIYSFALAEAVIKRYRPKCIIIDFRPNEFTVSDKGTISSLFPYKDNKVIRNYFNYNSPYENVKLLSHIYPYNSLLASLLIDKTNLLAERGENYKGYLPLPGIDETIRLSSFREGKTIDMEKVKYFNELLNKLNKANIPTLIVMSPGYYNYIDGPTANITKAVCARYPSVQFLNFSHNSVFKNSNYFKDRAHLNETGAAVFSNELIAPVKALTKSR